MKKVFLLFVFAALFPVYLVYASCRQLADTTAHQFSALQSQFEELMTKEQYEQARKLAESSANQFRQQKGEFSSEYITALGWLGEVSTKLSKLAQAEEYYLTLKRTLAKIGTKDERYVACLTSLANVYQLVDNYKSAREQLVEATTILQSEKKETSKSYGSLMDVLGTVYYGESNYTEAINCFLKAIQVYEKTISTESEEFAGALNNLAVCYNRTNRYLEAEKLYVRVLSIEKKLHGEEHTEYATTLRNLTRVYESLGRYEEVPALYEKIIAIQKKNPALDYTITLNNFAVFLEYTGKYWESEKLHKEALALKKQLVGTQHKMYVYSLSNLAQLYKMMGRFDESIEYHKRALVSFAKITDEETDDYATVCLNLAGAYLEKDMNTEAYSLLEKALSISRKYEYKNRAFTNVLSSLTKYYHNTNDLVKEDSVLRVILDFRKKNNGENHPLYANTLNLYAAMQAEKGLYEAAEKMFLQVLEIRKNKLGTQHPDYGDTLRELLLLYLKNNRLTEALSIYPQYQANQQRFVNYIFPALTENEKEQYFRTFNNDSKQLLSIEPTTENKSILTGLIYNDQLFRKNIVLHSLRAEKRQLFQSQDTASKALYLTWIRQKNYLSKLYNQTIAARENAGIQLDQFEREVDSLEKQLVTRSGLFAANRKLHTDWKQLGLQLKKTEACVELIRYTQSKSEAVRYAALILKPDSEQPELVVFPNGNDLESHYLQAYRNDIRNQTYDADAYAWFWKPIADRLSGVKTVYLAADGVYHQINLQTLLNSQTGKYAGEERSIRLLTSTRELVQKTPPVAGEAFALFGFPDYEQKPGNTIAATTGTEHSLYPADIERGNDCKPLPGTKAEVEAISKIVSLKKQKPSLFLANAATEEAVKALQTPRVLHIATHGYFEPSFANQPRRNPMLRSGLLLAGAKRTLDRKDSLSAAAEDGILTAYEATALNLDGTELVVLSACETGLGEVKNGEGVYGLQRAFAIAGAQSVLMSLWKVGDQPTQLLMKEFYRRWLGGTAAQVALRKAQAAVRKRYAHPYYWGGFVLVGR
jgi:CHAT domain-containing protein